ncbi:MAG: hypothetical protein WC742_03270 [Gallionellaceae bacterium]|jgi:hypothetical protein
MRNSPKTLLFLGGRHFQSYIWNNGTLSEPNEFSNDAEGQRLFSEFLQTHRDPACLLADVIEEDFRQEVVPHLTGKNRRELIARKFEQYYRTTQFRQARTLRRQVAGRRDDEMLFSALTNPQLIDPWLDILLARNIPLIGIYSVPHVSTSLINGLHSEHILLLSWEDKVGLRQSYFNNKHLYFSRLSPVQDHLSFSESVVAETPRIQQYLKSLSLPPQGQALDVYIICGTGDQLLLEARLHGEEHLRYTYANIQQFNPSIKAKLISPESDATPIFLNVLASKPPANHYANAIHTHFHLLWNLRRMLFGLAVFIALIAAIWSSYALLQGREFGVETDSLLKQSVQLAGQIEQTKSLFPESEVPAEDMKAAVTTMYKLDKYFPPPGDFLGELTQVLDQYVRVRLITLNWQSNGAEASPSVYPAQTIILEGELQDFAGNYRSALAYLEDFRQALIQHGYSVTTLKEPLDITPQGIINGDEQSQLVQFSLKVIWRNKP